MKQFLISKTAVVISLCEAVPYALVGLFARLAIAPVFWRSGQTKVDGFQLNESAVLLFQYEYNIPFPVVAAHMAALGEHLFPILLVLGLGTRFAALGLLVMTIVIQFVYPEGWWNFHALWLAILIFLVAKGGGALSLDEWVRRTYLPAFGTGTRAGVQNFISREEK